MWKWILSFFAALFLLGSPGCAKALKSLAGDTVTQTMQNTSNTILEIVKEQGVLKDAALAVDGQAINPGIRIENGLMWVTVVRTEGVSGQMSTAANLDATRLPRGVLDSIIDNCQRTTRTPEEFAACMKVLTEFNRSPAGGNSAGG